MSSATPTDRAATCGTPHCDNPSPHGVVCSNCVADVRRDLRELLPRTETRLTHTGEVAGPRHHREVLTEKRDVVEPGLLAELQVTLARQDASGAEHIPEPPEEARTGDGPPAASTVLLFRPVASDAGRYLHEVLEHWTRQLLDTHGIRDVDAFGMPAPRRSVGPNTWTAEYAAWLERHPDSITSNLDAGALVENIRWAIEDVRRVVFPRQLRYCGPCTCGEPLYAGVGKKTVRCRACRTSWVIADRMAQLRNEAEGRLLTDDEMARALPRIAADIPLTPLNASQIRGYGFRGRLATYPQPDGPIRYKVGDVISLMHLLLKEQQDRASRAAAKTSATTRNRMVAAHERFREALRA